MIPIIKACLLFTFMLCYSNHATENSLIVTFVDETGSPLRNVEVQLSNLRTEKKLYQKSTKAGLASFSGLDFEGTYELRAQLEGFISITDQVKATGNQKLKKVLPSKHYFEMVENEALLNIKDHKYSSAIANLQKLLEIRSEDALLHDTLARAFAGSLDLDNALVEAEKAARLDPQFEPTKRELQLLVLRGLGEKSLEGHDFKKATDYFLTLTRLDPRMGDAYYGLSLAYGH
jgi:tetratricopeptide (TPR) repeat protein